MKAWVINPLITESYINSANGNVNWLRRPKVELMDDPGRILVHNVTGVTSIGKYWHSTIADDVGLDEGKWCLSYVTGKDFTPIINDPECIIIHDFSVGDLTIRTTNHPNINKLKRELEKSSIPLDLDTDKPMHKVIVELGKQLNLEFKTTKGTWVIDR